MSAKVTNISDYKRDKAKKEIIDRVNASGVFAPIESETKEEITIRRMRECASKLKW